MADSSPFYLPQRIETDRLLLRILQSGDGRMLHEAASESFAELHPWMEFAKKPTTVSETENFVREAAHRFLSRDELNFILLRKADQQVVGALGVHHIDWEVPCFELGYWARTSLSGQGYMTEALRALVRFVFDALNAERAEIRCDSRNDRSAALARRADFTLEATLRHQARANDDSLRDTLVFALLRNEYLVLYGRGGVT